MTTQTLDEMLTQARAAEHEAGMAHREAATAVNMAEHALGRWENESKLRRPVAHRGLDAALELVPAELHRRFTDLYPKLCMEGVAAVPPQTLAELAGLYLASTPEFAAVLRAMLDGDPPDGHPGLLDVTDAEHAEQRAARKAELAELQRVKADRAAELRTASERVSRLDRGLVN